MPVSSDEEHKQPGIPLMTAKQHATRNSQSGYSMWLKTQVATSCQHKVELDPIQCNPVRNIVAKKRDKLLASALTAL